MKTGYFLPVSLNPRLVLRWGIIILSFERTLFYEFNKEGNWFLTILAIASYIIFITLIWPHRFFIADDELVEVTPENIRMRKRILSKEQRMKQAFRKK